MQEYANEFADIWLNVPNALERAGELWLVRAGGNRAKPNYVIGPKVIDCFGFHFILKGKLKLEYEGRQVLLHKHDIFCLLPGISYVYGIQPASESLEMIWLTLDGRQVPELLSCMGINRNTPYTRNRMNRSTTHQLRTLIDLLLTDQSEPIQRQVRLLQLFASLMEPPEEPLHAKERQRKSWVKTAGAYLRLHFSEPLSIVELAATAGVHRSHFTSLFTREMGASPQQYVLRMRMDKAAAMLSEASLSITEIALSVGYSDLYSFSRAFKKYFGCSPSQWIK
ncbi:helix-turn-helix domain-containing protein [Paenibacillus sp. LMG 31456]|uniref:Helix-turn-helix domain-containing protein n=1 Tax=Paenibacillus foliorum TaxID=2654974 RepID=A0A972JWS9_9BACL|nr:AraC family transcriptional regulator [Paenibacillus foliorum]NOU91734.1 helix-turn-helix domain-containing protein [Paenibacillus foliorum]